MGGRVEEEGICFVEIDIARRKRWRERGREREGEREREKSSRYFCL